MKTYYLIDYENDGQNGLNGCEKLTSSDFIYVFYTDNSKKINLDILKNSYSKMGYKKVPVGDQSLNKHLIAYLGYLVGKNDNTSTEYVIISSDKGYDKVCEFLQEESGNTISVSRRSTIVSKQVIQKKKQNQMLKRKRVYLRWIQQGKQN